MQELLNFIDHIIWSAYKLLLNPLCCFHKLFYKFESFHRFLFLLIKRTNTKNDSVETRAEQLIEHAC